MAARRNVLFRSSAFNTTQVHDYFINECCFGDDVARWLAAGLRSRGVESVGEPGQEDFGWYVSFRFGAQWYTIVLGWRPGEGDKPGDWMATIERRVGLLKSLFGQGARDVEAGALQAIDSVLKASPEISAVRWFSDAESRTEDGGAATPS